MFYGLSAFCADLLVILGPLIILSVEAPRISDWLARRRLDPLLHPAAPEAATGAPPHGMAGLLDETNTERIHVSEWLRGELSATKPQAAPGRSESEPVAVGGNVAADTRTRQRARGPRP